MKLQRDNSELENLGARQTLERPDEPESEVKSFEVNPGPLHDHHGGPPLWTWALLAAAVTAVSSAGVVFAMMAEVPTFTLAAWRLQLTSVLLGIAAAFQFWRLPAEGRLRTLRSSWMLGLSGSALAVHFGSWVYSVQHTSLSHSLLFVSATPLILAGGAWVLRKPISPGELAGTGVGMVGAVILATAAVRSDQQVTVKGDLAALLGSFAFVAYLLIGQNLRRWMSIFIYGFAVTSLAATLLTLTAIAIEGARPGAAGQGGCFGYLLSLDYLPKILYLGIVPGILGHQGFNTLLRYMQPLIITLGCNMEPLLGSALGWAAGVMAPPGLWTYVGGTLVMVSTVAVTLAAHCRERAQAVGAAQYTPVQQEEAPRSALGVEGDAEAGNWPAGPHPADTSGHVGRWGVAALGSQPGSSQARAGSQPKQEQQQRRQFSSDSGVALERIESWGAWGGKGAGQGVTGRQ